MSDMDPLYQLMESSAQDMSEAAVQLKQMMTGDINTDVNIPGYGAMPAFAKQVKNRVGEMTRVYASTTEAQTAVNEGRIPTGYTVRVIGGTDNSMLLFYANVDGVLTAVLDSNGNQLVEPTAGAYIALQSEVQSVEANVAKAFVITEYQGMFAALCDDAGWVVWKVSGDGGFGTLQAYLGINDIKAGDLKIEYTSEVAWRLIGEDGFYIDVFDNYGNYLLGDNGGGGGSSSDYATIQDLKNKAYADSFCRRLITRAKFPSEAYNHFIMQSQSLGVGFMSWPAVSKTPKYDTLMLGQSVRPASVSANSFTPLGVNNWQPLKAVVQSTSGSAILSDADQQALARSAGNEGESPLVGAVNGLRRHFLEARCLPSDPSRLFVASAVGVSGQSLANLLDDTKYYNRLVDCVTKAKALADAEGKAYSVTAMTFMQGEQDYAIGTTQSAYMSLLQQMYDKVNSTIKGVTGQKENPVWFFYQTGYTYSPNPATQPLNAVELWVGMAQWQFCQQTKNCFLVGPNYQLPDKGGHLMTNGSRWMGCYFAKAMDVVFNQRRAFHPLAPIDFKCSGKDIFVSYFVEHPPLKFVSPFRIGTRTAIPNRGFRVWHNVQDDPAGVGTEMNIVSVTIAADTVIQVNCEEEPQGTIRVVYGTYAQYGQGMVTDSDTYVPDEIYEYDAQFTQWPEENISELIGKPYPMENWSIAFSQTLTKE